MVQATADHGGVDEHGYHFIAAACTRFSRAANRRQPASCGVRPAPARSIARTGHSRGRPSQSWGPAGQFVLAAGRAEHWESGMINIAIAYRLCSPPTFWTISLSDKGRSTVSHESVRQPPKVMSNWTRSMADGKADRAERNVVTWFAAAARCVPWLTFPESRTARFSNVRAWRCSDNNRRSVLRKMDAAPRAVASCGGSARETGTHSSCALRLRGTSHWQHDQEDGF
jgi:hypothetical protein